MDQRLIWRPGRRESDQPLQQSRCSQTVSQRSHSPSLSPPPSRFLTTNELPGSIFMSQKATPTNRRVSLACVPCRSKHLRCDATAPVCARCRSEGLQCVYAKSRRGGRRTRQPHPQSQLSSDNSLSAQQPIPNTSAPPIAPCPAASTDDDRSTSRNSNTNSNTNSDALSDSSLPEQFVARYYSFFHFAHPCVLPQWALKRRLANDSQPLQALVAVLQYIGSVYAKSTLSASLKAEAEQAISTLATNGTGTGSGSGSAMFTGFDVQAVLLFSIAIYWGNEPEKSMTLLDRAIAMALQLGMPSKEFAYSNGDNDPLLEECWRRTWWQIYMTDAHIAGSTSTYPFRTSGMEMSVDLPCDEDAYESGVSPWLKNISFKNICPWLTTDRKYLLREHSRTTI